jgi:hypothetical protein
MPLDFGNHPARLRSPSLSGRTPSHTRERARGVSRTSHFALRTARDIN